MSRGYTPGLILFDPHRGSYYERLVAVGALCPSYSISDMSPTSGLSSDYSYPECVMTLCKQRHNGDSAHSDTTINFPYRLPSYHINNIHMKIEII